MPGFNNGVMYANNVRFDGTPYPGEVTTDGQLLIGATAAPNIRVGVPTGSGGIVVTPGPGTLNIGWGPSTVEQFVYSSLRTVLLCDTVIPFDNTIPANTEGNEVLTCSITPVHAGSFLWIQFSGLVTANTPTSSTIALFQDDIGPALAATCHGSSSVAAIPTNNDSATLTHVMQAGTTNQITFKIRAGPAAGGQGSGTVINAGYYGGSVQQLYGGVAATMLTIMEIRNTLV